MSFCTNVIPDEGGICLKEILLHRITLLSKLILDSSTQCENFIRHSRLRELIIQITEVNCEGKFFRHVNFQLLHIQYAVIIEIIKARLIIGCADKFQIIHRKKCKSEIR